MKRIVLSILAIAAFAAVLAQARPARAYWVWVERTPNPYARRHLYLGAEGVLVGVLHETGPRSFLENGGGFNLFVGGRVHRSLALELGWQPTFHNNRTDIFGRPISTIGLDVVAVDLKVFPLHGPIQPYFTAGVGGYWLSDRFAPFAAGGGYQIGGGSDFWVATWGSLGFKVQYRGVGLVDYDVTRDNTYLSLLTAAVNFTGRF